MSIKREQLRPGGTPSGAAVAEGAEWLLAPGDEEGKAVNLPSWGARSSHSCGSLGGREAGPGVGPDLGQKDQPEVRAQLPLTP